LTPHGRVPMLDLLPLDFSIGDPGQLPRRPEALARGAASSRGAAAYEDRVTGSTASLRTLYAVATVWPRFAKHFAGHQAASTPLSASRRSAEHRLLSPKLRTLRYLHIRWDGYPAGTTFAGTGLSPAGTTNLSRRTWTGTVVQERLGHSQISITLDTYSRVLPTMQREAAAKLDGMMRWTPEKRTVR
jgi:hypothetical protein